MKNNTIKLLESIKSNLNELYLEKEKEELFNQIKEYNPNAIKENYKKLSKQQMLVILTKLRNAKKSIEKKSIDDEPKIDLDSDYDTDESIASKTDSDTGLEYFNKE